jgi:hypothetical protein
VKEDEIVMNTFIDRRKKNENQERKEVCEGRKQGSVRRKEGRKMKDSEIER